MCGAWEEGYDYAQGYAVGETDSGVSSGINDWLIGWGWGAVQRALVWCVYIMTNVEP